MLFFPLFYGALGGVAAWLIANAIRTLAQKALGSRRVANTECYSHNRACIWRRERILCAEFAFIFEPPFTGHTDL